METTTDLRKFSQAEAQKNLAITALKKFTVVENPETRARLEGILRKAKIVETLIEDKRKELVAPLNAEAKRINEYAKDITAGLDNAITGGKRLLITYAEAEQRKIEAAQRDKEARERAEEKARQEKEDELRRKQDELEAAKGKEAEKIQKQ